MSRALCVCGHDVDSHGLCGCDVCGCGLPEGMHVLHRRAIESDRIRKSMQLWAAAETDKQLHPVVVMNEERRTA